MERETRYLMWEAGKYRLPPMRPGLAVYTTKIHAPPLQGVQVDLFRDGKRLTLIDEVLWDKFPSEELLAKIALVL